MAASPASPRKLAYLVSRYPAISHTFIFREVQGLRARGFSIETASINGLDRPLSQLPADEAADAARTLLIKPGGAALALPALFTSPAVLLRGLAAALRYAGADVKRIVLFLFYWIEALILLRWLRRQGCSHLHVHFASQAATVALIAHRASGLPFSLSVHGPDEFDEVSAMLLPEKIRAAKFLLTIGDFCRSQLLKHSPPTEWSKIHVAPLGVDPSEFSPRPEPAGPFTIVCVGRLVPQKGQNLLIEALAALPSARLQLIGGGPDRESLEAQARSFNVASRVEFTGPLSRHQISVRLAQAHAFALPSFAEGIPVSLMEAMACEVPVVSTYIAGIPELIRPGVDGLLVPPSNLPALVEALSNLSSDPALRRRLGAAGRARVLDRYNLPHNLDRLAAILNAHV